MVAIGVRMKVENDMGRKDKGGSQVGYKRPPVEHRFKKGQSGNPHGRRRRTPATVAAIFAEELQSTAVISENGRRLKVSKMRVLIKQAVKQAMNGNFQPLILLTKFSHSLEQLSGTVTSPATDSSGEDQFSHLSDEELEKHLQETVAAFGLMLVPAKKKGDQGGDD
jgi:hypothetical protein